MQYYRITADLQSPLVVQQNRQSNSSVNLPYLPGSSLRGALAAQYIRMGGSPEDMQFQQIFIDDAVHFPNLLPTDRSKTISKAFPLTSVSCKREPGFIAEERHGVVDLLASKLKAQLQFEIAGDNICNCCGQEMKSIDGFWNGDEAAPARFRPSMIYQRHTGIDRATGTVAQSIFFIRQAIADFYKDPKTKKYERQRLSGGVYLSGQQLSILNPLLEMPVFAGAERTSGMGELRLTVDKAEEFAPAFDIETWDKEFRKKYAEVGNVDLPDGEYFCIKFESDAIMVDEFLRPATHLRLDFEDVELEMQITKTKAIRGWQSSWGLPKPDDIGVTMGSVFLYRYTGDDLQGLIRHLSVELISGIGLRREEGFGKISICNSAHTIKEVM